LLSSDSARVREVDRDCDRSSPHSQQKAVVGSSCAMLPARRFSTSMSMGDRQPLRSPAWYAATALAERHPALVSDSRLSRHRVFDATNDGIRIAASVRTNGPTVSRGRVHMLVRLSLSFDVTVLARSGPSFAWRKCMGRLAGTASPVVLPVTLMSPRLVATADSERLSPAVGATKYRRSEAAVHVRCQPHRPGSYLREVGTILPTCVG
jgi:hypothetical protein